MKRSFILGVVVAGVAGFAVSKIIEGITQDEKEDFISVNVKLGKNITRPAKQIQNLLSPAPIEPEERLSVILNYLKTKKQAGMHDLERLFPKISRRTIRRDMDKLEESGKVRQVGLTKDSKYILVR
jgi:predicted HTH transcriptional regulator